MIRIFTNFYIIYLSNINYYKTNKNIVIFIDFFFSMSFSIKPKMIPANSKVTKLPIIMGICLFIIP